MHEVKMDVLSLRSMDAAKMTESPSEYKQSASIHLVNPL